MSVSNFNGITLSALGRAYADAAALEEATQRFNREITAAGWTTDEFMERAEALAAASGVSAAEAATNVALNASEMAADG